MTYLENIGPGSTGACDPYIINARNAIRHTAKIILDRLLTGTTKAYRQHSSLFHGCTAPVQYPIGRVE